jgi:hypothetical protein
MDTPSVVFCCQISCFLAQVLPRMPEATEAAGVPLRLWFLSAATVYVSTVKKLALSKLTCGMRFMQACIGTNSPAGTFSLVSPSSTSCSADDREWHRDWQVC